MSLLQRRAYAAVTRALSWVRVEPRRDDSAALLLNRGCASRANTHSDQPRYPYCQTLVKLSVTVAPLQPSWFAAVSAMLSVAVATVPEVVLAKTLVAVVLTVPTV